MTTSITLELSGSVNGAAVSGSGQCSLDPAAGRLELTMEVPRVPLGWDPALAVSVAVDALLLAQRAGPPDPGLPALVRTRQVLLDEQVGEAALAAVVRRVGTGLAVRLQFEGARFRLELLEKFVRIEAPARAITMSVAGLRVLTSACPSGRAGGAGTGRSRPRTARSTRRGWRSWSWSSPRIWRASGSGRTGRGWPSQWPSSGGRSRGR